ncbi:MAG: GNAT family N-acetyltransferase [Ferruginibacter sp.]
MNGISVDKREGKDFIIFKDESQELGYIEIHSDDKTVEALHTEVKPEAAGKGVGKKLYDGFINYARKNNLKVKSSCSFISAQLLKHNEDVKDLLQK